MSDAPAVLLDRSGEPWLGSFPGLGEVRVFCDGTYDVTVDPTTPEPAQCEAALTHGWAQLLGLVRQGHRMLFATAMAPPDKDGCLLLVGELAAVDLVAAQLAACPSGDGHGWTCLADRVTPTRREEDALLVIPRPGPWLLGESAAATTGQPHEPARSNTDAVLLPRPKRRDAPVVRAIVTATRHPVLGESGWQELAGHDRFAAVCDLCVEGALATGDPTEPGDSIAEALRLAVLPVGRLVVGDTAPGLPDMLRWWERQ